MTDLAPAAPKPKPANASKPDVKGTAYVVLVETETGLSIHSTQTAVSDIAAIQAAHGAKSVATATENGSEVTLIAVPERSFRRRKLRVEKVVRTRIA